LLVLTRILRERHDYLAEYVGSVWKTECSIVPRCPKRSRQEGDGGERQRQVTVVGTVTVDVAGW
jgi:hypothetical protein